MRVFLTGATGGVGSFVVKELLDNKFKVACLVRNNHKPLPEGAEAIVGDLTDLLPIEKPFSDFAPDTIIHLGWIGVDQKDKENLSQILNLQAATDLLLLAQKYGVKSFIGLGSESEYGPHHKTIDETVATRPRTKYAVAKLATGLLSEKMCKDGNINFTWLRLFSSYGPGDRPGSLMSLLIKTLLKNEPMKLSQCIQTWDYIHARDIARLITQIASQPRESGFFNLGGGQAQIIKNIVTMIADQIDPKATLLFGEIPYGPNQNMHLEADISKLKRVYGWSPQTTLEEGIKETISWHRSQAKV